MAITIISGARLFIRRHCSLFCKIAVNKNRKNLFSKESAAIMELSRQQVIYEPTRINRGTSCRWCCASPPWSGKPDRTHPLPTWTPGFKVLVCRDIFFLVPNLNRWIRSVEKSELACFDGFIKTLQKYKPCILNYFKDRKNSGFVEGLNNKVKVAKRRCYGLLKTESFFQRLFLDLRGYAVFN